MGGENDFDRFAKKCSQNNKIKSMNTLTKLAFAAPMLAIALAVQAYGPNTAAGHSAGIACGGGCTNSTVLACGGGCTNAAVLACGGCTNSVTFACGGCTNSTTFACGGCTNNVSFTFIGCTNLALLACGGGCTNSITL